MTRLIFVVAAAVVIGCGTDRDNAAVVDSSLVATMMPDSAAAADLRDSATTILATLLEDPTTATFDSLVVVQPPREGRRVPNMVVCGKIGGRPGVNGQATPARFLFRTRWAVFVEDDKNRAEFADLWSRGCAAPGATVVLQ